MPPVTTKPARLMLAGALRGVAVLGTDLFKVHLYKNNFTPTVDSVIGDFTLATFTGYAYRQLQYEANGVPALVGVLAEVRISDALIVWDCTGSPHTVYGWALQDVTSGDVHWAEKYDVPHVLDIGSRHTLDVKVRIGQCD